MGFIKETQDILASYRDGFEKENERYSKIEDENRVKLHRELITERGYKEAMATPNDEHRKALDELLRSHEQMVRDALSKYETSLDQRYLRTSESIDAADVSLLSSDAVQLSAADVEAMFAKYEGNAAMQGVVSDYESKHKTGANITYYTHDVRKAAAEDYAGGVIGSMKNINGNTLGMAFAYYESAAAVPGALAGE